MKITMFSDYVCPFCYIGKTALFQALEGLDAEIEFHPFELRRPPVAKVDPMHDEMRLKRFDEVIHPIAEKLGVEMKLPWISPHPYTTLAFQGYYFACDYGLGAAYNDAVYHAFYVEEKDIGEMDVLHEILKSLKLDPEAFDKAVQEGVYMDVLNDQYRLREETQIKGVPTYFINGRRVSGVYDADEFRKILAEEFGEELSGMTCGPDGCK